MDKEFTTHHEELIDRYFPVDKENKTVDIKIYYDNATDMLDFTVGEIHKEMFSNDVLDKVSEVTERIPDGYKANVVFVVSDYCDYKAAELLEKLNDMIEINNFEVIRDKKKNFFLSAILALVGFSILLFLNVAKTYAWLGHDNQLSRTIVEEMLDISGWVFIWEAVTVAFLSPSEIINISAKLLMRINSFAIADRNNRIVKKETRTDIMNAFALQSKFINIKNNVLLVLSSLLIAFGFYSIASNISEIITNVGGVFNDYSGDDKKLLIGIFTGIALFETFIEACAIVVGVTGIFVYKGSERGKKLLKIFIPILVSLTIINIIVVAIVLKTFSSLAGQILLIIVELTIMFIAYSFKRHKSVDVLFEEDETIEEE